MQHKHTFYWTYPSQYAWVWLNNGCEALHGFGSHCYRRLAQHLQNLQVKPHSDHETKQKNDMNKNRAGPIN